MDEQFKQYVIISPVKDEERFVRETLESVTQQTVRPARWVIVDDGSTDSTPHIVQEFAARFDWIRLVHTQGGPRQPGSAVIRAFQYGTQFLSDVDYDFIVKLDCDLRLPAYYFELLLLRFALDPALGIASGVYQEKKRGRMQIVPMPKYHAAGASKLLRRKCFEDIRGFIPERGWDTLDEVRAHLHGWKTCHFSDLVMDHLKPEGTGIGWMRTNIMHGEIYYKTGGSLLFFLGKLAARAIHGRPFVFGSAAMLYGFAAPYFQGTKRLVNAEEARHYRSLLNQRLLEGMKRGLGRTY